MPSPNPAASPLNPRLSTTLQEFIAARPPGADEDVHMVPAVVDHVIARCTRPGDTVLDPFAGFGTTLTRAALARREAVGVELLPERVAHLRTHAPAARVIPGDARRLAELLPGDAGSVSLVLTSPPYMTATDHDDDPMTGYRAGGGDYRRYLRELTSVARQSAALLKPGGYLVWNVGDIFHQGVHTPLIDDCARLLEQHLTPVATVEIDWDQLPHDLTRDALIVARRAG